MRQHTTPENRRRINRLHGPFSLENKLGQKLLNCNRRQTHLLGDDCLVRLSRLQLPDLVPDGRDLRLMQEIITLRRQIGTIHPATDCRGRPPRRHAMQCRHRRQGVRLRACTLHDYVSTCCHLTNAASAMMIPARQTVNGVLQS